MATLVLSTVGTVLGGPVGSAIGALIGQSIDQELFAPGRRGPRLGDLSIQTSSYGTQVPRIYGTMRVAGSVVWSTDLVESSETTGAKGQPDTTFGYSVSFAVAVSSRPIHGIGRIWADGKLIRGEDGIFKVSTGFRTYDGSEDQELDPLIASVEGLASTPGYRGLALAVFENLELVEFGNRIPFLTFEVFGGEAVPEIGSILADVTGGIVQSGSDQPVAGYAAHGQSIRSAIEPLVETFAIALFDDGASMKSPGNTVPTDVGEQDLGNSADGKQGPRFQRSQLPMRSLPGALSLSYYDPTRDFQAGEARAAAGERQATEEQQLLPLVLQPEAAKMLAQQILARRWARRDSVTVRLPVKFLALKPGERLELPLTPRLWTVERITIEGFVSVAELRPSWSPAAHVAMAAAAPQMLARSASLAAEPQVALFEVPQASQPSSSDLTMLVAVSSPDAEWKSRGCEIRVAGRRHLVRPTAQKAVMGTALTVLGSGEPHLIDMTSKVEVGLLDRSQWLTSCEDDELIAGTNLALLGGELFQFGDAAPLGDGRFELSRLLRGRAGTEWAAAGHGVGETFALVETNCLRSVPIPLWAKDSEVGVRLRNVDGTLGREVAMVATGESLRPPTPVHLVAERTEAGALLLRWVRRSRQGWAWIDEVDAPLGECREEYRIVLRGTGGVVELTSASPSIEIGAAALLEVGTGPVSLDVRQVGDWGVSHPCHGHVVLT